MIKLFLLTLVSASTLFAQSFDGKKAFDFANELASDKYEGRRSGHPGGQKAEEYIANYCKVLGLDPMGTDGFFQPVPMLVTEEQNASMSITGSELGKITFVQGLDFNLVTHTGSKYVNTEAVIVGHGLFSEEKGHNDYGDVDVDGKIVVILRGEPKSPYSFAEENRRSRMMEWAKQRGAVGVMWHDRSMPVNGAAIPEKSYDPSFPMIYIGDRVLQVLLENTGYSIKSYQDKIQKDVAPLNTGKQVSLTIGNKQIKGKTGRNVCAMKFGTDAVLKNEIIVVGAHLDHCGINANKIIYNGAGDNASGSGLIAELARAIAEGPALKRSVMFIWFTGEEDGLLGSKHFVEQPTVPFGNIVAMLNFDMVGQGDGGSAITGLEQLGSIGRAWADSISHAAKPSKLSMYDGEGASDYAPFAEFGAPGIAFWSSGSHPFYHHFCDDGGWLNVESFKTVGTQAEALIRHLGTQQQSLAARSDSIRVITRYATTLDIDGFFVDKTGTVKSSPSIEAAWLPHNSSTPITELISSAAHLHTYCSGKEITSTGLKDAVNKLNELKQGVMIAIPEVGLQKRPLQDIVTLTKMGLSLVHLTPGAEATKLAMSEETFKTLKAAGVYALIPIDYNTSPRVQRWGSQSIVTSSLAKFAEAPKEIRDSLLVSSALLLIDVDSEPTLEQIESIRASRQRYVHLNFGESFDDMRESDQKAAIRKLYEAGFSRDDMFNLTGKNLRRFLNG